MSSAAVSSAPDTFGEVFAAPFAALNSRRFFDPLVLATGVALTARSFRDAIAIPPYVTACRVVKLMLRTLLGHF
jgi:hypothetical protein